MVSFETSESIRRITNQNIDSSSGIMLDNTGLCNDAVYAHTIFTHNTFFQPIKIFIFPVISYLIKGS